MINFLIIYIIQTAISLFVFFILYELVFKNDSNFQFLRYYFLLTIGVSALLPLTNLNFYSFLNNTIDYPIVISPIHSFVEYSLSEIIVYANKPETGSTHLSSYMRLPYIMIGIYIAGFAVTLLRVLFFTTRILFLSAKYGVEKLNGLKLVRIPGVPTFSFFNKVFIDSNVEITSTDLDIILSHERVHINQKHTVDLFVSELLISIQWFNPVAYLLRNRIKENHEFIADYEVVSNFGDINSYSRLLIENSTLIKTNILTHNFSYSLLKRRLSMIENQKRTKLISIKLLWLALAVVVVFFACSSPSSDEIITGDDTTINTNKTVYTTVEKMPEFIGGHDKLVEYISKNVTYPEQAHKEGITGKVVVNFVIDETGKVKDANVVKGVNPELDKEAIRVVSAMPNWIPGENRGVGVQVSMNLPINFALNNEGKKDVFTVVEVMPEFPGGKKAMIKYLSENIVYPEIAKKNNVEGRVFVNFIVEKNGEVSNVNVLRGVGSGCDKEAVRVIKSMPNWTPGTQRGEAVRVSFNLPINFTLN